MKELPIPALAAPDCLVITWVTNRQKHLRFVKEELYPHWSIRSVAEWHWVKVSTTMPPKPFLSKLLNCSSLLCFLDDTFGTVLLNSFPAGTEL